MMKKLGTYALRRDNISIGKDNAENEMNVSQGRQALADLIRSSDNKEEEKVKEMGKADNDESSTVRGKLRNIVTRLKSKQIEKAE